MNKKCKLLVNVDIKITSNVIILKKGIYNFFNVEITKQDNFSEAEFCQLMALMVQLQKGETIAYVSGNDKINEVLVFLKKYDFITFEEWAIFPEHIICDFKDYSIISNFPSFKNSYITNFDDYHNLVLPNNSFLVVIVNDFSLMKLKAMNKYFLKKEYPVLYLINDDKYVHLLYVNNDYSGCFECFNLRIMARVNNNNFPKLGVLEGVKTYLETNCGNVLLILALANSIIENSANYQSLLMESKLFSIYLPTFEVHIDKLLKVPYCDTCGYVSQRQAAALNVNTKTIIRKIISDGK